MKRLEYAGSKYRWKKPNGKYEYYVIRECWCGERFITGKYGEVQHCSDKCKGRIAGRPLGYKVSDGTRERISEGRTNKKHTTETKDKIRESVAIGGFYHNGFIEHPHGSNHPSYKHGHTTANSPLYSKWMAVYSRCYNKNNRDFKYYGEKGIGMCNDWKTNFINFKDWCENNGYEPGLHLHRENSEKDYSPENCVFLEASTHSRVHAIMRKQNANYLSLVL